MAGYVVFRPVRAGVISSVDMGGGVKSNPNKVTFFYDKTAMAHWLIAVLFIYNLRLGLLKSATERLRTIVRRHRRR